MPAKRLLWKQTPRLLLFRHTYVCVCVYISIGALFFSWQWESSRWILFGFYDKLDDAGCFNGTVRPNLGLGLPGGVHLVHIGNRIWLETEIIYDAKGQPPREEKNKRGAETSGQTLDLFGKTNNSAEGVVSITPAITHSKKEKENEIKTWGKTFCRFRISPQTYFTCSGLVFLFSLSRSTLMDPI